MNKEQGMMNDECSSKFEVRHSSKLSGCWMNFARIISWVELILVDPELHREVYVADKLVNS